VVGSGIAFADGGAQRLTGTAEDWPLLAVADV